MKNYSLIKFIFVLIVLILLGHTICFNVASQTKNSTSSSSVSSFSLSTEDDNIKILKEKIATKVAELREKNNRAISGFILEIAADVIKIKDKKDDQYEIKLDSALTKYYQIIGFQKKEINRQDIKKGASVIATGVLSDKIINANVIYIDEMFLVKSGKVTEIDKENYRLKIISTDKDNYNLEIETTTKQLMIDYKTLELRKTGFSKIKEGDTIHFVVKTTGYENNNTYSALKILIIPQEYFIK